MIVICLATFNGEKYLREQLDSLFAQTYKEWRILIHDDNSTDNTVKIIYEYMEKFPNIIEFIDDDISYGTSSANFSSLLEQTSDEYVMFCDQDDIWFDKKVELTLNEMKKLETEHKNKALMVFSDLSIVDMCNKIISKSMWKSQKLNPNNIDDLYNILALNVVSGCTIMLNRVAKKLVSPIPKKYIQHDHWMVVNLVKYGYVSFVKEPLIFYRQHEGNVLGFNSVGISYFIKKIKKLSKNIRLFKNKYSFFDFEIDLSKVLFRKLLLNFKRLF